MYWQITRQNHARGLLDCAGKATPVRNTTTARTKGEALGNSNIGNFLSFFRMRLLFVSFPLQFNHGHEFITSLPDRRHARTWSTERNGVNRPTVILAIFARTVTLELNSNFIQKFTKVRSVTTCSRLAIVLGGFSVLLLTLNVSIFCGTRFYAM